MSLLENLSLTIHISRSLKENSWSRSRCYFLTILSWFCDPFDSCQILSYLIILSCMEAMSVGSSWRSHMNNLFLCCVLVGFPMAHFYSMLIFQSNIYPLNPIISLPSEPPLQKTRGISPGFMQLRSISTDWNRLGLWNFKYLY